MSLTDTYLCTQILFPSFLVLVYIKMYVVILKSRKSITLFLTNKSLLSFSNYSNFLLGIRAGTTCPQFSFKISHDFIILECWQLHHSQTHTVKLPIMERTSPWASRKSRSSWSPHQKNTNPNKIHHNRHKQFRKRRDYTTTVTRICCLVEIWLSS